MQNRNSNSGEKKSGCGTLMLMLIAWRNIRRNTRRTVLCLTAMGLAVFFAVFMQSWVMGIMETSEEVLRVFDMGHVNVVSKEYEANREYFPVQYPVAEGRNAEELAALIRTLPGVRAVFPRINAYATLQDSTVKHAVLWGLNIEEEMALSHFNLTKRNNGLVEGRFPGKEGNECAVGRAFAQKTGLAIGDFIPLKTVSAQFSDKLWSPRIVGIFDFNYRKYDEGVIMVSFERFQRLLVLEGGTQQMIVHLADGRKSGEAAARIQGLLGSDVLAQEWRDNYFISFMQQNTGLYTVIYLVFQIVASFLIINTVVMIIHERIKEIGMMGSLGMSRGEIVEVFFFEAVFMSMAGSAAGCFLGGAATLAGSFFPIDMAMFMGNAMQDFPSTGTMFLKFSPLILLQGFFFGVVVACVCTLIPSLKSAFVEPVEALRR